MRHTIDATYRCDNHLSSEHGRKENDDLRISYYGQETRDFSPYGRLLENRNVATVITDNGFRVDDEECSGDDSPISLLGKFTSVIYKYCQSGFHTGT